MYYFLSFLIYMLIILFGVLYVKHLLKTCDKNDKKNFEKTFRKELAKGVSKSDLKYRKNRVKTLPLYQRFLYWTWFNSIIAMMLLPAILLYVLRVHLIDILFIPYTAVYFQTGSVASLFFGIGAFLFAIPLLVGYSYLTNRGIIRKADLLYQMGSFQEYPKAFNMMICVILLIVAIPIMIMNLNNYSYCTDKTIVIKPTFALSEKTYKYSNIEYIQKKVYSDGNFDYIIYCDDGKKYIIYDNGSGNKELNMVLTSNDVKIK